MKQHDIDYVVQQNQNAEKIYDSTDNEDDDDKYQHASFVDQRGEGEVRSFQFDEIPS